MKCDPDNWLYSQTKEFYGLEFSFQLKERIRDRDGRICQFCERTEAENRRKYGGRLDVHHIDYDKGHNDEANLVSLCKSCHSKTKSDKEFWTVFYQELMERKIPESLLDSDKREKK